MPVNFLTKEKKEQYGQFSGEPDEVQLARYFYLDEADHELIAQRRGEQNKLGFAIQLTSVRFLGTFVSEMESVPVNLQQFVAKQLEIIGIDVLSDYAQRETTKREHTALIRRHYGYEEFTHPPWAFRLSRRLYSRAWISDERPGRMFDYATSWLIRHKVLLPGVTTLTRLISEIRERTNRRLSNLLSDLASNKQKGKLDSLLTVPEGSHNSLFDHYRQGPVTISSTTFNVCMKRYRELREYGAGQLNFSHIPPTRIATLARNAGIISMHKILRMSDEKRWGILLAFVKTYEIISLDDAMDVLDLMVIDVAREAKKRERKNRLRTLKDMDKSALTLANVCTLFLGKEPPDHELRAHIFARYSKARLEASITTIRNLARPPHEDSQSEMVEQYLKARRVLQELFNIEFKVADKSGTPVIKSLNYLRENLLSSKNHLDDPPLEIVTKPWERHVFDGDGQVNKKAYTVCFMAQLQHHLQRRNVYVVNSDRWGNPRIKLLSDKEWECLRIQVCRTLGHSSSAKETINNLSREVDETYKRVAENFTENDMVQIDRSGKYPSLTISNLDALEDPESLKALRKQVSGLLPRIDLSELILEIHAHTGFAHEFTHVSESSARAKDLDVSVCAVLMAEACNIGLEPLIKPHIPALTRHRLDWVKQNYIRAETLSKANARLVDYHSTLPLANKWGGGEIASADGMRFVTSVKTIHAGPNQKYFGGNRGLTWYNLMSNQCSGLNGETVPGTIRDSIYLLQVVLEQQTGLKPTEIMTDTAGASDMIFGLFWLLGYQFSPRLADAGESLFWRIDKNADYGVLNEMARGQISTNRIEDYWDEMLRTAGSLKLGKIQASELVRTLLRSDRPSGLAKAIMEVGRINETLYLD